MRLRGVNPRRWLTPAEEEEVLGIRIHSAPPPAAEGALTVGACPVGLDYVEAAEQFLDQLLLPEKAAVRPQGCRTVMPPGTGQSLAEARRAFPLDAQTFTGELGQEIVTELADSWGCYERAARYRLQVREPFLYRHRAQEVREKVQEVRRYLCGVLDAVSAVTAADTAPLAFAMRRAANLAPVATLADMVRGAVAHAVAQKRKGAGHGADPGTAPATGVPRHVWNPFLSAQAWDHFAEVVLLYLQLCVLQQRLQRLAWHAETGNEVRLEQELRVRRVWNVMDHPEWLLFEAEQGMLSSSRHRIFVAASLLARLLRRGSAASHACSASLPPFHANRGGAVFGRG